ncbi:MAG: bifunctional oligoribonuclease/PAP phosphatase NrnA, partial [Oscillospiraceae bacterium]|nr:bifunctional oligoribonuclease/PAP phosphatase NrnA [Oscillospiraceae bacterium]
GLASKTIEIAGVDIGITLKERDNGSIRVSVRSTEAADSAAICREFEGGGHVRASGCRIFDTIQNAERRLVEVCLKQLEQEKV